MIATDFHGQDLRRASLCRRDLRFASLEAADLRGTDFEGANLRGADLRFVRTGMNPAWAASMVVVALVASVALGVISGVAGNYVEAMISSADPRQRSLGVVALGAVVVLVGGLAIRGLRFTLRTSLPFIAALAVTTGILAIATHTGTGRGAIAILLLATLCILVVAFGAFARALAGAAGMLFFIIVAVSGVVAARAAGGGILATVMAISAMIAGRRALRGGDAFPKLSRAIIQIACAGGTSFRSADLRGARFDGAHLRACDFRGARLEGANFNEARASLCLFDGDRSEAPTSP